MVETSNAWYKYNPKRHEWRGNGWRHHVPYYVLGKHGAIIKCSEPNCEMNKVKD